MSGGSYAKEIARKRSRYKTLEVFNSPGYSMKPFENLCDTNNKTCHDCCTYTKETDTCDYDGDMCNRYFAKNVTNWETLCGYHILFLEGKTPGTPESPGSWNKETSIILDPLISMLKGLILTLDSQPGLAIYDEDYGNYIQKPYIQIGGPADRIHKILKDILFPKEIVTLNNSIIKYVSYGLVNIKFDGYENYQQDGKEYVAVILGIDTPEILTSDYVDYIFSNRFFDTIVRSVYKN